MLMVDLPKTNARITIAEILSSGRRLVSNPIAFSTFTSGISATEELLLNNCWQLSAGASSNFAFFRTLLHDVLPTIYDVRHLESLGGRFCLRLTGIGDFTVIALNRRVVTLKGSPVDDTGAPVIDAEIRPDAFMALCNELLANLSEKTLMLLEARANAIAHPNS
jgi:hypothetical protein